MEIKRENASVSVKDLSKYEKNSRTHSPEQVAQIAASIKEFGFTAPAIVSRGRSGALTIIAGHGRVMAAESLGMVEIPCVILDGLSEQAIRALVLADNKLAMNAGWDDALLSAELLKLHEAPDLLALTGFTGKEFDVLLCRTVARPSEDSTPESAPPRSVLGDIWQLGSHRVMCGDSTSITDVEKLLAGDKVDMVMTDPPYGIKAVGKNGKIGGDNLAKNGVYKPVAGDENTDVAVEAIHLIKTLAAKVEIIWGGNYYASHLPDSSCWLVWDKENGENNFADAELAWTNQKSAVRIFKHLWNGMMRGGDKKSEGKKRVHPTQKPVALNEWCLTSYGKDCKIVLDLFGGSGSALIACEKTGHSCRMMELSPEYVDIIIKRWEEFTGQEATLVRPAA